MKTLAPDMEKTLAPDMELAQHLKRSLPNGQYSFVTFEDSDKIQLSGDPWPSRKWEQELYLQTATNEPRIITRIVLNFIEANPLDFSYVFFMHYNFGLVQINNDMLFTKWATLIEIDGDEIFCYIPNRNEWICME